MITHKIKPQPFHLDMHTRTFITRTFVTRTFISTSTSASCTACTLRTLTCAR